jgi:uncharacterized protein YgiM (DUF1202 family)
MGLPAFLLLRAALLLPVLALAASPTPSAGTSLSTSPSPNPAASAAPADPNAPRAWPHYEAVIAKDSVNLRLEPSLHARLAADRAPKGTKLTVQRAADEHWYEILDPDAYRGFFVREDMVTLAPSEKH